MVLSVDVLLSLAVHGVVAHGDGALGVAEKVDGAYSLSQSKAIKVLLAKAGLHKDNVNTPKIPLPTDAVLTCSVFSAEKLSAAEQSLYRSFLASCIYFVMWTRPDMAYAQSKLSKFMQDPGPVHMKLLTHLLRYLKSTQDCGLVYDFSNGPRCLSS